MKRIIFLLLLVTFTGCKMQKKAAEKSKAAFIKLNLNEVSASQKNRAYSLGKRVLMTCNTSTFKPFTTQEATAEVIKNTNKERISLTCHNILRGFGQFQDMKLIEILRFEKEGINVYRYQCDYEKKYRIKELRVSMNDENQITAITTKDWTDEY